MNRLIIKLIASFARRTIDGYLVTDAVNIAYLTGFPSADSWLIVSPKKCVYITDFRYVAQARAGLKNNITVVRYTRSIGDAVADTTRRLSIARLGFDERHLSVDDLKRLRRCMRGTARLVPANNMVEQVREIKTAAELRSMRAAVALNLRAYDFLRRIVKPRMTERSVLEQLEGFVRRNNARFSFEPIIASGPNSCFPHAVVTDRRIKDNDIILIDIGIDIGGYKSDLTRIFFLGKIPPLARKIYMHVCEAQQRAIVTIKPGTLACDIDKEARNYLKKHRLARFFGHSLGHGVGREVHEGPAISSQSTAVLAEGMVFTVEPAVYIPHRFGIRIEDVVLVTKHGCKVLSR